MKAHIPAAARLMHREIKAIREYDASVQNEILMRYLKLCGVVLNRHFGFGHDRIAEFFGAVSTAAEEAEKDPIFWEHIDQVIIGELKLPFDRENYKEMDR